MHDSWVNHSFKSDLFNQWFLQFWTNCSKEPKTAGLALTKCARACQTYVQFVAVNCGIEIHRHGVSRACILCSLRSSRPCKVKSWQRAHQIRLRAPRLNAATALRPVMQSADVVDSTSAGELSAEGDVCLCGLLVLDYSVTYLCLSDKSIRAWQLGALHS